MSESSKAIQIINLYRKLATSPIFIHHSNLPHIMSSQRTELGVFAKLPPELRLCIWDWLLPYADTKRYPEMEWPRRNTSLTILCTSKRLHDEISHHLYSNLTVSFTIDPLDSSWTCCRLRKFRLRFTLGCMGRASYLGLNNFPFHRVHVRIDILPPKPSSPGQLILLFERLQVLVDFLSMAKSIRTMDIHLLHAADKGRKWHKQGKPLRSLTYAPRFDYEFMDHQIVSLPFCRLQNVSSKKLRHSKKCGRVRDWTILSDTGAYFRDDGDRTAYEFDDIDLFFSKLNRCFIDRVEKRLPGGIARALRHQLEQWTKAGMQKDAFKFDILCSRKWYRHRHSGCLHSDNIPLESYG